METAFLTLGDESVTMPPTNRRSRPAKHLTVLRASTPRPREPVAEFCRFALLSFVVSLQKTMLLPPRNEREQMPPSLHYQAHGGTVLCIAEIGIYRCSLTDHERCMQRAEERLIGLANSSDHVAKTLLHDFAERKWTPWLYNQVVAWLRLLAYPRQNENVNPRVTGEYYAVDAKRLSASLKYKRFLWAAEAFAVEIENESRVFELVSEEIQRWASSPKIRKFTLDLSVWNTVGPFIEWDRIFDVRSTLDRSKQAETGATADRPRE